MKIYKKDLLEMLRQYKLLVLLIGMTFMAVLEPVMLKLMPNILGSQLGERGLELAALIEVSALEAVSSYVGNAYQLFPIALAFLVGGTFSKELSSNTLVIPHTKGIKLSSVYTSKLLVTLGLVIGSYLIAGLINFYYSNVIFDDLKVGFGVFLRLHGHSQLILIHFIVAMLTIDVFVKKAWVASVGALVYYLVFSGIVSIMGELAKYSPFYLTRGTAKYFNESFIGWILINGLMIGFSLLKLRKMKITS